MHPWFLSLAILTLIFCDPVNLILFSFFSLFEIWEVSLFTGIGASKKIDHKIDHERFRGNIYTDGLKAWEERNLIDKTLIINNVKFRVIKEIPRCSATNIRPNSSEYNLSIPISLKKIYKKSQIICY